jgi:acetoin utilization deacetylase AcuC-like enzyme
MSRGRRVLLLTDPAMDRHVTPGHPERPDRRSAAADGVRDGAARAGAGLGEPEFAALDDAVITTVHPAAYLAMLDEAESRGGGWLDSDTYLVGGSMHAARLAAGATVAAARAVTQDPVAVAFAVVRPPGHHAAAARGTGFCLLNNVAIAVGALRSAGLARRVAIVDWDVHHGDGTQAIFDEDADLCYASTHQSPLYPGSGAASERGVGAAAGTKHNRPLAPGSGDTELLAAWRDDLLPAIAAFEPQAVLVSAGYDGHRADPLAELTLTEDGYRQLGRAVGELASGAGLPGVALTLEGGYDLDALRTSVAASVEGILAGLAADPAG